METIAMKEHRQRQEDKRIVKAAFRLLKPVIPRPYQKSNSGYKVLCPNCNHIFTPRKAVKKCPKCKNILPLDIQQRIADNTPPMAFCYRCGKEWQPYPGTEVKRCPRCNSAKWDKPLRPPGETLEECEIHKKYRQFKKINKNTNENLGFHYVPYIDLVY